MNQREPITEDIEQIVRIDKTSQVVPLIEDSGDSVKEAVR